MKIVWLEVYRFCASNVENGVGQFFTSVFGRPLKKSIIFLKYITPGNILNPNML